MVKQKNLRGDTIIEVILCIAVLGTAMAVAYVSTSHSLQVGTDSGNRDRALGYMQQQVEFIKFAEQSDKNILDNYTSNPGKPFCIDPVSKGKVDASSAGACTLCVNSGQSVVGIADSSGNCASGNTSTSIAITYNDSSRIFTTTANWAAPNGSGQDQSVTYYKLPENIAATTLPKACPLPSPNPISEDDSPGLLLVSNTLGHRVMYATLNAPWAPNPACIYALSVQSGLQRIPSPAQPNQQMFLEFCTDITSSCTINQAYGSVSASPLYRTPTLTNDINEPTLTSSTTNYTFTIGSTPIKYILLKHCSLRPGSIPAPSPNTCQTQTNSVDVYDITFSGS